MRRRFRSALVAMGLVGNFVGIKAFVDEGGFGLPTTEARAEISVWKGAETELEVVSKQHHRLEEFVSDEDEADRSGSAQNWPATTSPLAVTEENFKMNRVAVLPEEGIIYCHIPKVASAEWMRVLRWIAGVPAWESKKYLHLFVHNGLTPLSQWKFQKSLEALRSERFFSFVVVRDPAERLVSAFLNKCVAEDFVRSRSCPYLTFAPHLFPGIEKESKKSTLRFKEMIETEPEKTLYEFAAGMLRWVKQHHDNPCLVNMHYKPQTCFCDLPETLPAFYVMRFSNLSAEAAAFAGRLPEALSRSMYAENATVSFDEAAKMKWDSGVKESRREEIREFTTARFEVPHDERVKITNATDRKSAFLSERTMKIVREFYLSDYQLFGQYFSDENSS